LMGSEMRGNGAGIDEIARDLQKSWDPLFNAGIGPM